MNSNNDCVVVGFLPPVNAKPLTTNLEAGSTAIITHGDRRCGRCGKIGHNARTCTAVATNVLDILPDRGHDDDAREEEEVTQQNAHEAPTGEFTDEEEEFNQADADTFFASEGQGTRTEVNRQSLSSVDGVTSGELRESLYKLVLGSATELGETERGIFRSKYAEWLALLHAGNSVLLHGFGSKKALLDDFAAWLPSNSAVITLPGYATNASSRDLLTSLLRGLHLSAPKANDAVLLALIRRAFAASEARASAAAKFGSNLVSPEIRALATQSGPYTTGGILKAILELIPDRPVELRVEEGAECALCDEDSLAGVDRTPCTREPLAPPTAAEGAQIQGTQIRVKKTRTRLAVSEDNPNVTDLVVPAAIEKARMAETPKKRGRGRPPATSTPSPPSRHAAIEKDEDEDEETSVAETPKKRGRGRPRKRPLTGDATPSRRKCATPGCTQLDHHIGPCDLEAREFTTNRALQGTISRRTRLACSPLSNTDEANESTASVGGARSFASSSELAIAASRAPDHLYIIIHSIDGIALRHEKHQAVFAALASIPQVHIIASCSHRNAALLWDGYQARSFNWSWQAAHTRMPSAFELRDKVHQLLDKLLDSVHTTAGRSAQVVLDALTPNARKVFCLLISHQLNNLTSSGLTFRELYEKCKANMCASSEPALKQHMREFQDHHLVRLRRGGGDKQFYYCTLDKDMMDQIRKQE